MFCGKCGNKVKDTDKYCENCGNSIDAQKKENKSTLIKALKNAALVIPMLAIIALIVTGSWKILIIFLMIEGLVIDICFIWFVPKIIKSIININKKISLKTKKTVAITLTTAILVGFMGTTCYKLYKEKNIDVYTTIINTSYCDLYCEKYFYFIYNDKIYYETGDYDENSRFYKVDFDGKNNELIAKTDQLKFPQFYFVYNNYAYYYTSYHGKNKKVNLSTGEILDVEIKDDYIPLTFNNGIVNTMYNNAVYGNSYFNFAKYDLNTNSEIYHTRINQSIDYKKFLDYDTGNVYYIESDNMPSALYKNNEVVYELTSEKDFLMIKDTILYMYDKDKIYKFDTTTNQIISEEPLKYSDIVRISSGNNRNNYFYWNNGIYTYDFSNEKFLKIIGNIAERPDYVYSTNNYLIFRKDYIRETGNIQGTGNAIIYDKNNKTVEVINNVEKISIDDKNAYLLILTENSYEIKKINI